MDPLFHYGLGQTIELKKAHPCMARSHLFEVVRLGADIKIKCLGCQTILLMTRDHLNSQIKRIL
jgi:hypothetical protein